MIKDYKRKKYFLIYLSALKVKEYNKISKYEDQEKEIKKMRHKKGRDTHITKIRGCPSLYRIQNIALCRNYHVFRQHYQCY